MWDTSCVDTLSHHIFLEFEIGLTRRLNPRKSSICRRKVCVYVIGVDECHTPTLRRSSRAVRHAHEAQNLFLFRVARTLYLRSVHEQHNGQFGRVID